MIQEIYMLIPKKLKLGEGEKEEGEEEGEEEEEEEEEKEEEEEEGKGEEENNILPIWSPSVLKKIVSHSHYITALT